MYVAFIYSHAPTETEIMTFSIPFYHIEKCIGVLGAVCKRSRCPSLKCKKVQTLRCEILCDFYTVLFCLKDLYLFGNPTDVFMSLS